MGIIRPSYFDAVAESEADAAVGIDRCMIQQFSPGLRVKCCHLLRQAAQGADELLRCGLVGNQGGDLPGYFVVLGLDAIVPAGQFIVALLVFLLVEVDFGRFLCYN